MSFSIDKVEVSNFRTHEYREFEPKRNGVTVIKGANGTGKSSLVDSIAWCLFGVKPNGVNKNADLKRKSASKEDKCYVNVYIHTLDGNDYKVQRRILGAKGSAECDIWKINNEKHDNITKEEQENDKVIQDNDETKQKENEDIDLEHVAGSSVTHATQFLNALLGINEKEFLASMFVQQKQVDELLTANPKDRAQIIEKMTGISALTQAVNDIKTSTRDAKKTSEVLSKNTDSFNLDKLKTELNEIQSKIKEYNKKESSIKEKGKSQKESLAKSQQDLNEYKEIEQNIKSIKHNIENTKNTRSLLEDNKKDIEKNITDNKKELKSLEVTNTSSKTSEDIKNEYSVLSKEISSQKDKLSTMKTKIKATKENISELLDNNTEVIYKFCNEEDNNEDTNKNSFSKVLKLETIVEKLSTEMKKTEKTNKSLETKNSSEKKEVEKLEFENLNNEKIIDALDGQDHTCPTCKQKPDNVEEILKTTKKNIALNRKKISSKKSKIEENEITLNRNLEEYKSLTNAYEDINEAIKIIPEYNKDREEYESLLNNYKKDKESYESLKTVYDNILIISRIRSDIKQLENNKKGIVEKISTYKTTLKNQENKYKEYNKEIKSLDDIEILKSRLQKDSELYEDLKSQMYEVKENISVANANMSHIENNIEKAEIASKEYAKSLKQLEKLTASSSLVSTFRENRIEHVIPELSFIASDLLQRFTDGKFVGMKIDTSYKAQVELPDGKMRDVGLLSGGELSAVALALRLSIALLSQGKVAEGSTMILDEVLVSQDEERVESIITTIKDVMKGQVILIGHNGDSISSIADNIIELS